MDMGPDLKQYVEGLQKRGYTRQQIEGYLLGLGYDKEAISKAFEKKPLFSFLSRQPDMRLVGYIEDSIAKGYNEQSIESMLRQYYKPRDIRLAMDAVQGKEVRHVIDVSNKAFLLVFLGILALGAVGALLYLSQGSPKQLLDYRIDVDISEVSPGEQLHFTNSFINMGAERKYDIILEYKLTNVKTGTVLESMGETIGVSTTLENRRTMDVPKDAAPGRYRIEGIARYGKDIATSYANIQVVKPGIAPSCSDGIRNQGESDVDCGGPCEDCESGDCRDNIRNRDEEGVDCGGVCPPCERQSCSDRIRNQNEEGIDCGGVCPSCKTDDVSPDNEEILSKVEGMGARDEAESVRLCDQIDSGKIKDDCYLLISETFNHSKYCSFLVSKSATNICYSNFVQRGDYTICEKIEDIWIRRSCESLKQIEEVLRQQNVSMPSAPG
jgi:hypothetical protein